MKKILFLILIFSALFFACENQTRQSCDQASVNRRAYFFMKDWYLWYKTLPNINPADYETLSEMLSELKYREGDKIIDRFSYAIKKTEHDDYYAGKRYGMGTSWKRDEDGRLFVFLVYPDSPAGDAGLKRGHQILAINDVSIEELDENSRYNLEHANDKNFVEKTDWNNVYNAENQGEAVKIKVLEDGQKEIETTLYLDDYTMKSVLTAKVLENDGKKIGYLNFKAFISPSEDELNEAFAMFKSEKIEKLVLDLRYNGGGLVRIAEQLINLIGGKKTDGEKIIKIIFNDKHSDQNSDYIGKNLDNSLDSIDELAVIATRGTASASEMVINSLAPYLNVYVIGTTTYGKPVGMNSKDICDQTIIPITFKYANSEDYGDFYLGIEADCAAEDDCAHDFGDDNEDSLKEALYMLANKKCSEDSIEVKRRLNQNYFLEELIPFRLKGVNKIDYSF